MSLSIGQLYDKLFDNLQKGDYADLVHFDLNEVGDWYNEAQKFVETLENIINKELEKIRARNFKLRYTDLENRDLLREWKTSKR